MKRTYPSGHAKRKKSLETSLLTAKAKLSDSSWFFTINKMTSPLIISIITVVWIKGVYLSKDKQVFQTPNDLFWTPNTEVNLSLTHKIPSYDTILWYQRSAGDTALKLIAYMYYKTPKIEPGFENKFNVSGDGEKTAYLHILNLKHPEDSGEYFGAASMPTAEAYFGGGTKLTVLDPELTVTPPTVKVLRPSAKECKNSRGNAGKTIVCLASRFYPDHVSVSWQVGGVDTIPGVATDNAALQGDDKYYTITSRLRVSAKEWYDPNTEFKCIVSFYNGKDTESYSDSIYGEKAKEGVLTREKYLKITQTAKLSYGVFIVKSMVYGVFVAFLVWKLQNSSGKRNH